MLNKLKALWNGIPDGVKRVIHTAWIAFAVTFGGGLIPIIHVYLQTFDLSGAVTAAGALAITTLLAAGTAVRVYVASLLSKGALTARK